MNTFWTQTSGTWINVATVVVGCGIGLGLRGSLPKGMQQVMTQGLGLITLLIGLTMANSLNTVKVGAIAGMIVGLVGLVSGGLLGEAIGLEARLEAWGDWLKQRVSGGGRFTEGFVAASLLFCVGPMALIGSLNNGLSGDDALLTIKATMDGIAAIALSSSYGIGVGFSSLPILIYQGGLSVMAARLAQMVGDPGSHPQVLLASGVGGLMIVGIALNLLEVTQVRVASFLPALVIAPLFYMIAEWMS